MDRDGLHRELDRQLRRHGVPGCAIAVQRGAEARTLCFGRADPTRAVDRDTVFHLFSGTKLYTAAAVMLLVERGLVDLDADVRAYLPDLALRHPITVRQLASHASGLKDTLRALMAVHAIGDEAPSTATSLAQYKTSNGRPPGRGAAYRNVSYAILGHLITEVSGAPYTAFVQEELLGPLRVEASFEPVAHRAQAAGTIGRFDPMRALLHLLTPDVGRWIEREREGSRVWLADFALDTAAIGGLVGRAEDFLPLCRELLTREDGLLRAASKQAMLTVQARGRAGIASVEGVGIGWKRGVRDGVAFWNHEGGGPGFTSETRIYPDDDLAVIVLMNATQSRRLSWLAHDLCERLREEPPCGSVRE